MKKLVYVLIFLMAAFSVNGQNDLSLKKEKKGLEIKPGLMFNPQGCISLKTPENGFEALYPLQALISISKGNSYLYPFYSLGENFFGGYAIQSFNGFDIYLLGMKDINSIETYAGLGIDIFIGKTEDNSIFFEIGKSMNFLDEMGENVSSEMFFSIGLSYTVTISRNRN